MCLLAGLSRILGLPNLPSSMVMSCSRLCRRLMPWQHRYTHRSAAPPGIDAGEGTGGDNSSAPPSSTDGSRHGSSAADRSLRVPLERLVTRGQQPGRSMHSAR